MIRNDPDIDKEHHSVADASSVGAHCSRMREHLQPMPPLTARPLQGTTTGTDAAQCTQHIPSPYRSSGVSPAELFPEQRAVLCQTSAVLWQSPHVPLAQKYLSVG